ncbi:MAG: TonB family protein [Betaproteobacteria bacterium]|nr:TonB family protein [Betaproteobacteria bacterium]
MLTVTCLNQITTHHQNRLGNLTLLSAALILTLAGCKKAEREPTTSERLKAVEVQQETKSDFYVPRKAVDYLADLQKLKEAPAKPTPAPPAPPPVQAAAAPTPAKPAPTVAQAPTPEPARVTQATPQPAVQQPVAKAVPEPVAPPPAPVENAPPKTVVATAAPTARPDAPANDAAQVAIPINRPQPDFPREAINKGIEGGSVRVRLSINSNGEVTNVAILQATPARIFDRAVMQALLRWKFNPGADNRSAETEIVFKR